MTKFTNPELININLFSKPRTQVFIILAWGGHGTLSNIIQGDVNINTSTQSCHFTLLG